MLKTFYTVRVRDTYCGLKGEFVEDHTVPTAQEAKALVKQFREEYPTDCGFKVTQTQAVLRVLPGQPNVLA